MTTAKTKKIKTGPRAKSRLRGEIVDAMQGLRKVGAASGDELDKTTLRMLGQVALPKKKNPHWGTTLDALLGEEGIPGAAMAEGVIGMLAWQLTLEMRRKRLSKAALAKRMQTSPTQLDRVLMGKGNVTVETLQRAAALVGRELRLELI